MKLFRIVLLFATGMFPAYAFAGKNAVFENHEIREERSVNAFEVFRKACFVNYKSKEARLQIASENYRRAGEKKTAEILAFVRSESGTVWLTSPPPEVNFTIVMEENGNCHVIAERASAEKFHKQLKDLALDTRDSMTFSIVDYKGVQPDQSVQVSRFDVKDPDGSVFFSVFMTTRQNKDTENAEGVISILAPRKE